MRHGYSHVVHTCTDYHLKILFISSHCNITIFNHCPPFLTLTERVLEDHEKVLECLTHWPRTHNNHVLFKNNPEKYYLLKRPQVQTLNQPAIPTDNRLLWLMR